MTAKKLGSMAANWWCEWGFIPTAVTAALGLSIAPSVLAASDEIPLVLPATRMARVHAMDVTINTKAVGTWEILESQGGYWADGTAMRSWRLLLPTSAKPLLHGDRLWWPLFAIPGYRASFDQARQSLDVDVLPAAFEPHEVVSERPQRATPAPAISAVLLNYDVSWTESRTSMTNQSDRGLLTEAGWTSPWGVLLSTQVSRWQRIGEDQGTTAKSARLESSWTRDWPAHGLRMRLGDSWTPVSAWGRQAAFGGVQLGSNRLFGPFGAAIASPVLTGSAVTPSTVELYVNDVLRQSIQVPAGPFALSPGPSLMGTGEARLVVRDVLGRETVINRSFLTSASLLPPKQQEWSFELGRLRKGFGIDAPEQNYGNRVAQFWLRRGINESLTAEGRAQGGSGLSNISASFTMSLWNKALVEAGWAGSSDQSLRGSSAIVGLQHQGLGQTVSVRLIGSSHDYTEAGRTGLDRPAKLEASAAWRSALSSGSAWGFTLAELRRHDSSEVSTASLSFTQRLAPRTSLLWSASRVSYSGVPSLNSSNSLSRQVNNLQLLLVMPLGTLSEGQRPVMTAQWLRPLDSEGSRPGDALIGVSAAPKSNEDWGWRVQAGRRAGQAGAEGGFYRQVTSALIGLDTWAAEGGVRALRGNLQGAWLLAEGRVYATSRMKDSFALIEVPGHQGVGISLDGPTQVRTDSRGMALVPRISAFQPSRIRLDANDIPPDAEVETLEAITTAPWRSGVKVKFQAPPGRGAMLTFTVASEEPAPAGAWVTVEGDERTFIVGSAGRAYVTGLSADRTRRVKLSWRGQDCYVDVRWTAAEAVDAHAPILPRLGPWRCPGVQP